MKKETVRRANELKIEYIGFCSAERDEKLLEILKKRRESFGINPFEEKDAEKRTNPALLLENAKSIIVCLFPYKTAQEKEGNLASYAKVRDYHQVAKTKLENLAAKCLGGYKYICCVDTDPLCDRFLAYKAGLGFYGKNSMLINEKYGSYFAIGFILTDAFFEPDKPLGKKCAECGMCIKKCPGGAVLENFGFDYKKCLSYITQAKELDENQTELLKKSDKIIGCDICQSVCPHNINAALTPMEEFYQNEITDINYEDISALSNREFKEKYACFAFSWLGKKKILRNFTLRTNNITKKCGKI